MYVFLTGVGKATRHVQRFLDHEFCFHPCRILFQISLSISTGGGGGGGISCGCGGGGGAGVETRSAGAYKGDYTGE